jgi:hypothetical protein
MEQGAMMLKCGRMGKPHGRTVKLNLQTLCVEVSGTNKTKIPLISIRRVERGQTTPPFLRQSFTNDETARSFSIFYAERVKEKLVQRTLDLVCYDEDEHEIWVTAVEQLIIEHRLAKRKVAVHTAAGSAFANVSEHGISEVRAAKAANNEDEARKLAAGILQRAWRMKALRLPKSFEEAWSDEEEDPLSSIERLHLKEHEPPDMLFVTVLEAGNGLRPCDVPRRGPLARAKGMPRPQGTSDPFVELKCLGTHPGGEMVGKSRVWKTTVQSKTLAPKWEPAETFVFSVMEPSAMLELTVFDYDVYSKNDFMGKVAIPIRMARHRKIKKWFKLLNKRGQESKRSRGRIRVMLHWTHLK